MVTSGMPVRALRVGELLRNKGDGELWRIVAVAERGVTVELPDGTRSTLTLRQEPRPVNAIHYSS